MKSAPTTQAPRAAPSRPSRATPPDCVERLTDAIARARDFFFRTQRPDGHWVGELEGDTILESEYAVLLAFLGRCDDPKLARLANTIRSQQNEEGGWSIYPGGPTEISASIKAYWTCKLAGHDPDAPFMRRARERILALGGVTRANTFTKLYLAVLGLYPWEGCPAVPPVIILLPTWFYLNLYEMSSWSRAILVPLSIVWANKPRVDLPARARIDELFVPGADVRLPWDRRPFTWRNFFLALDRLMKLGDRLRLTPLRRRALQQCEAWMLARFEKTHGLAAIFPPMVNAVMAMKALGYPDDHPKLQWMLGEIEQLELPEGDALRLQPCFSPVWDTGIVVNALHFAGVAPDHPVVQQAARFMLQKEVREAGDWKIKVPHAEPGGWYFEYANEWYPDIDDTAMVIMALRRTQLEAPTAATNGNGHHNGNGTVSPPPALHAAGRLFTEEARIDAIQRGLAWVLAMQGSNGGWASFDKDNDKWILTQVPFADHNAMIDPSTADITGRLLEMLALFDYRRGHPVVERAIDFLKRDQRPDGSWFGRWGVNYIYGTWQVLRGLACAGEDLQAPYVRRAVAWLREVHNPDGGWGESLASYDNEAQKGIGLSTASQTAWALMGLLAAGEAGEAVARGVRWLLDHQNADGSWSDASWTGAGFPRVFYLKYHLYQCEFPLMALGQVRGFDQDARRRGRTEAEPALGFIVRKEDSE